MKKIFFSMMLCIIVTVALVGCGKNSTEDNGGTNGTGGSENGASAEEVPAVEVADAAELLTNVWNTYEEADKFPIGGGDYENMVSDVPGKFDVSKAEDMDSMLGFPAGSVAQIDDAASMLHMMNANTFTAGAYHISDSGEVQAVADALKDNIVNRQWICGFPDTLIVASVGNEYVVSAFGNAEIIETFKTKLQAEYEMTEILHEENLVQ